MMTLVLLVAVELAGSVFQLLMVAYPHNYFWPKLGPEVENNMFKIPILFIYVLIYSFYPFHGGGGGGGGGGLSILILFIDICYYL